MKNIETFKNFNIINEKLDVTEKKHGNYTKLIFSIDSDTIGYIDYEYYGDAISEHTPSDEKEFYISMIEVYTEHSGNDFSSKILNHVKSYAKKLGATMITLRVDYGMGYNNRDNTGYLDKIYLKNGFKYSFTENECDEDDCKPLESMEYKLN